MRRYLRSFRSWIRAEPTVAATLAGGLLIALVLILVGDLSAPSARRADLWFEVAKIGVQFGVIVILGALVTLLLKRRDETREERRRAAEYGLQIFRDVVDAYNRAKGVRRSLRALGFRLDEPPRDEQEPLDSTQVAEFHAQMLQLNDAQLTLERIAREVKKRNDVFPHAGRMLCQLDTAEKYLAKVLGTWETRRDVIKVGGDPARLFDLEQLQGFVGSPDGTRGLTPNLSRPVERFQDALLEDLLPHPDVAEGKRTKESA
jgi:hypothetical protein